MDSTQQFIISQTSPLTADLEFITAVSLEAIDGLEDWGIPVTHPLFKPLNEAAIVGAKAVLKVLAEREPEGVEEGQQEESVDGASLLARILRAVSERLDSDEDEHDGE